MALAFAPSALADGSIIGASATVGPTTVTASVAPAGVEVSTSAAAPAVPVATPVAKPPVKTGSAAPHRAAAIAVISDGGTGVRAAVSTATASITHLLNAAGTRTVSRHATPVARRATAARAVSRPRLASARGRPTVLPQAAVLPRSFTKGFLHFRRAEIGTSAADMSAGGLDAPQLPAPGLPSAPGSAALGAVGSGIGIALLLFVLAAELSLTGLPRLGRRVLPLFPAARPYPYVLQLERPD